MTKLGAGRLAAGLVTVLLGMVGLPGVASSAPAPATPLAAALPDPALLGSSADQAAGSCWEIKQVRPSAPSGAYWLVTPSMAEPQRFYCDQTTNGGGWVLVGKGRNGWTMDDAGTGTPASLLNTGYAGSTDTHQYSTELVNQLLGGGRVVDLTEGIRVRRAMDTAGTAWQEVRFRPDTRQTGWSWAFGARFDVGSWSFTPDSVGGSGTASGSGGLSDYFGTGSSWTRVRTNPEAITAWSHGFAYGDSVSGTNAGGSYLWSSTNGGARAIPVAQVYLRPRVTSDDADFNPLPSAGTSKHERRALHQSSADVLPWGVSGLAGSTTREGSVEVQEFLQAHGRMYVAGNFRYVQRDASGTGRVEQSFLAAFNLSTGEWVSSFRPTLNEQVRTLELSTTGAIIAGGDFTRANGAPASAIVALDPDTGATDTSFKLTIENRVVGGVLRVWALDRIGTMLYLGGEFSHLKGGPSTSASYMRSLARVRVTDGRTTAGWNPEMNGPVVAIDASTNGTRIYAAGHFTSSRGVATRRVAAVLTTFVTRTDGSIQHLASPAWTPVWSAAVDYQQAIVEVGNRVWSGGSEHSVFGFDRATFQRTSSTILHLKGDVQTMAVDGNVLYAGSHSNNQYAYTGATTWSGSGPGGPWTSAHTQHWIGAYDATTGASLGDFAPSIQMRIGQGIWASTVDSNGRLWVGGDIATVRSNAGVRFSGGFARYSRRDATAPGIPSSFRVVRSTEETVTLGWGGRTDPTGVRYQVLRGDRPIATTTETQIIVPIGGEPGDIERYFVRTADGAGNRSASTPVLNFEVPGDISGDPITLVARGAAWTWRYGAGAPLAAWNRVGYNDTAWNQAGTAPLGFAPAGSSGQVVTDIDRFASTANRPLAAYFRKKFQVADPSTLRQIVIRGIADDGAVFYVNGVEVGRQNMPAGTVTYQTYASTSRRLSVADDNPVVLSVPGNLLVAGTNVVAAETHLNYKATPDVTFYLSLTAVVVN